MSVMDRLNQAYAKRGGMNPKQARENAVAQGGIGEGTEAWDRLSTSEKTRRYVDEGQGAMDRSLQAGVSAAMPGFQDELQGIRENAIRRGVDLGDIGTRNEGSLASAFQRNIANASGQMAGQNYQTALDRLYGYRDYRTAQDEAKANRRAAGLGAVASLGGMALGSPLGASIGGKIGSWVGKMGANKAIRGVAEMGNPMWY